MRVEIGHTQILYDQSYTSYKGSYFELFVYV